MFEQLLSLNQARLQMPQADPSDSAVPEPLASEAAQTHRTQRAFRSPAKETYVRAI